MNTALGPAIQSQPGRSPGGPLEIAPGVSLLAQSIVNLYFLNDRPATTNGSWVLVDAGLPFSARQIARAARQRFGSSSRPSAILLTHGHFDHVGGLPELADWWDVPVYAHEFELPYLTGRSSYPPPDPTVGGGAMSYLSPLYPRGPIDLGRRVLPLPADGSVPGMPDWQWVATPGHSPGHVAFYRQADGTLLAGDAFVTTRQESALAAFAKWPLVWRPPAYYTCDWQAARESIERLAALKPQLAATGHGVPLYGEQLRRGLASLVAHWDQIAPSHGRYYDRPALTDEEGVVALPPSALKPILAGAMAVGAFAFAGWMLWRRSERN